MNDDLPSDFDVIIIGTGLTESILAAALARIGQSVLHLDRNDFYSGDWASFNFQALNEWIRTNKTRNADIFADCKADYEIHESESTIKMCCHSETVSNISDNFYIKELDSEDEEIEAEELRLSNLKKSSKVLSSLKIPLKKSTNSDTVSEKTDCIGKSARSKEINTLDHLSSSQTIVADNKYDAMGSDSIKDSDRSHEAETSELSSPITIADQSRLESLTGLSTLQSDSTVVQSVQLDVESEPANLQSESNDVQLKKADIQSDSLDVQPRSTDIQPQSADVQTQPTELSLNPKVEPVDLQSQSTDLHKTPGNIQSESIDVPPPNPVDVSHYNSHKKKTSCDDKKHVHWTIRKIKREWRRFNLDLMPKILYCRGPMVELLISSDIAKYCEFKTVTRVLTYFKDHLEKVPCSRSDVFSNKKISMIEKRILMKLLTFIIDFENNEELFKDYVDKPFSQFLEAQKTTTSIMHYVINSIAMVTQDTSTLEGLKKSNKFLKSLGRYGNTAFLWPMYGSGEIPQCFCRMSAVFGGIYCLKRTAKEIIVENQKVKGIVDTKGKRINCRNLIAEFSYVPESLLPADDNVRTFSRAILLTDRSILKDEQENISLLTVASKDSKNGLVTILELSPTSGVCPKQMHVVHLTCEAVNSAEEDFRDIVQTFFKTHDDCENIKPTLLWSVYFNMQDKSEVKFNSVHNLDNFFVVSGPDIKLDFESSINEAKAIFSKLFPDEEFIPKAPNSEDIIFEDEEEGKTTNSGFESNEKSSIEELNNHEKSSKELNNQS